MSGGRLPARAPCKGKAGRGEGGRESKAWSAALRLLACRPRSVAELTARLGEKGHPRDAVASVVERLLAIGYLDDEAYARDWAAQAARHRGLAGLRIRLELQKRGVDRATAQRAVLEALGTGGESRLAAQVAKSRLERLGRPAGAADRRRLAAYLRRRGFAAEAISAALREALRCGGDDTEDNSLRSGTPDDDREV